MGLACSSRYNIEDTTEAQKQQRVISLRQKYLSNLAAEKLVELQKPEIRANKNRFVVLFRSYKQIQAQIDKLELCAAHFEQVCCYHFSKHISKFA